MTNTEALEPWIDAEGSTFREMQEQARKSDLYQQGDMRLVWFNEAALSELGDPFTPCPRTVEMCAQKAGTTALWGTDKSGLRDRIAQAIRALIKDENDD